MSSLKPTNITANRTSREFTINWSDGHRSVYQFALLRRACPCAECRGGHENMGKLPGPEIFSLPDENSAAMRLRNVEAVGGYAITLEWEDGHHYGIYTWDYLRAICACPECQSNYTGYK
ncbi:MAG: DUF971 domain-containing protein [Anaerolineales bacterium]|jgi:DUF971 family protein|nr:DUF971 domain-containing protein [Anaerolineales bacterium]